MRFFVLATTLIGLLLVKAVPVLGDTLQFEGPNGTITMDAPEIEIAPRMLRAIGGARVVLPPAPSVSIPGVRAMSGKKTEPKTPVAVPVEIEAPTVEVRYPAYRAEGGVKLTQGDVTMTAEQMSGNFEEDTIQASGGVVFRQGPRALFAQEFQYNYGTQTGQMLQARFVENHLNLYGAEIRAVQGTLHLYSAAATTCDKLEGADYRITAREIRITPDRKLTAKGVSLWLGNTRIIRLPRLVFSLAGRQAKRSIFPHPGYDRFDGFYLGMNLPVASSDRFVSALGIRWTTENGFQGRISNEYLLAGKESGPLTRLVTGAEVELRDRPALVPKERETGMDIEMRERAGRQLRSFADVSHEERVFDIEERSLLLSRLPEIGLKYVLPGLQVTDDVDLPELRSEGRISWGRFRESDQPGTTDRLDLRAFAAPTIISFSPKWYVLPVALGRWSHYSTGQDYATLGLSADLTRLFAPGTFGTLRYIKYFTQGHTPLEFDDVDVPQEVQAILQYRGKKNFLALSLRYNVDNSDLYDWQFTYGRTLHCLEPRITWRNRFSQLGIELKVLGF